MKQGFTLKILAVLLAITTVLSVSITIVDNSPVLSTPATGVKVLPAETFWEKTYGGTGDDRAFSAIPAGNGDFLVVGSSKSIVQDAMVGWALKLDQNGDAVWNQTYLVGSGVELRSAVNLTGGFLLVGNEFLPSGDINGYVARVDTQGVLIWNITVGGENIDKLFSATAVNDGFLLCGLTYSFGNSNVSSAWAVKIAVNGDVIWNKTFGRLVDYAARACVLCPDGNYLLAGYAAELSGSGDYDFLALKITTDGAVLWNNTYGGVGSQKAYAVAKADDGFVIVGDSTVDGGSTDAYLVKIDLNGNVVWTKTVGGNDADSPSTIVTCADGGFLVGGFTFSYGGGNRDFWLFKIDSVGNVLWSVTKGDKGFQEAYAVIDVGQNRFVMVGWTDPKGLPDLIGKATYDFYAVEVGPGKANDFLSSAKLILWAVTIAILVLFLGFATKMYKAKKKLGK